MSAFPYSRMLSILVLAAPILAGSSGRGQTSPTHSAGPPGEGARTLRGIVVEVLRTNPELAFYEAEMEVATAQRRGVARLADPTLNATVGRKTATGQGPGMEGVAWSVSVAQPFEWPGRLGLRKAIANQDVELARLGLERFRQALAGRASLLGFGLYAARETASAVEEVAGRVRSLREVLVQRDPAGLTPLLETRVIEATELNLQRRATEAHLAAEAALLELQQLLGLPPGSNLVVAAADPGLPSVPEPDILLARARTNCFELRVRQVELAQQGYRVDLARNERYPTVGIGPFVAEENAGSQRERIVGLAVSVPVPLWNRNRAGLEVAAARERQAETSYRVAERDVQRRVLSAAMTFDTKRREMAAWRPDAIGHFREAAEVADRHYRLGAVPIATYVELQKQYLEAVESLLDTRHEALQAAVELSLLTGLPLPPDLATEGGAAKEGGSHDQ